MREPRTPIMICPDFDRTGGYERQAFFLSRWFVRQGLRVRLVTNSIGTQPPYEVRDGVRIHRLSPLGRPNLPNLYASFLLFLRQHRHEFDVIHCHAFTFLSAACVPIARILHKPILVKVATQRDIQQFASGERPGMGISWKLLRRATRLLAISSAIEAEFRALGVATRKDSKQVALCPNGVDTATFSPQRVSELRQSARREFGISEDRLLFVFTGRLVARKAVDVLLRAFAKAELPANTQLAIVGDGEELDALQALVRQLRLDEAVRFVGEVPDVTPWLAAADVFVFPSRLEGLPNALLEAMACGRPPIVARIGGCIDVVDESCGIVFETDDVADLARSLETLALDPEMRRDLATGARHRIEARFSFDSIGNRLQEIYGSCFSD